MADNAQIIRGLYDAFGQGNIGMVLGALAPDVTWTESEGFPYGGTYTGPEAVLQNVFMKLGMEWEGFGTTSEIFIADGETVVVLGQYSGTYRATGKRFSAPFAHAWTLQNGKVASFQQYTDTAVIQSAMK